MDTSPGNDYPRLCFEVGLTCEVCTEASAVQLANVCKGLRGKMIGQLFVQIYPNPACAPMHSYFAAAYRAANASEPICEAEAETLETPMPNRKGPAPERRQVMVAVA
jgi:hypothetical protein